MSDVSAPSRRAASPSLRPALAVVGLALLIIVLGGVLALVGTSSARPGAVRGPSSVVPGSKLRAEPASTVIAHIESGGEPPAGIVSSLAVPAGSTYLSAQDNSRGVGQFDRTVRVAVPAPESEVKTFYLKVLSERHWVLQSISSPSSGASELIAEKNGSDGYQWSVGLIMRPTARLVAPALGGSGASAARTTVALELYQVGDAS